MDARAGDVFAEGGDVHRMVRLAVKRAIRLFDEYHDLDAASLTQDMMGEVARAWPKYDPTKSKPGTHAYRVTWCRLRDISRRRTVERRHQENARVVEGVKLSHVGPDEVSEGTDAELGEVLRRFFVMCKDEFDLKDVNPRSRDLSPRYPDRAQRLAILMFQKRMGWTCRQASALLCDRRAILLTIGVTHLPSPMFFSRANHLVTHVQKIFAATPARIAC